MRKTLTALVAALTFGGAIAATAPAQARPHGGWDGHRYGGYRYDYGHRHHNNDAGVAIAAGVVGLALGAALASNSGHRGYYDNRYSSYPRYGYGYGSYGYGSPGYGYGGYYPGYDYGYDRYRVCTTRRWVYDPYIGRDVLVKSRYAC